MIYLISLNKCFNVKSPSNQNLLQVINSISALPYPEVVIFIKMAKHTLQQTQTESNVSKLSSTFTLGLLQNIFPVGLNSIDRNEKLVSNLLV